MAKKPETTAIVFVQKAWYDDTLRFLIHMPKSGSTVDVHHLQGPIREGLDPVGLWMTGVTGHIDSKGSKALMDLLIPWQFVLGYAVMPQPPGSPIGFQSRDVKA